MNLNLFLFCITLVFVALRCGIFELKKRVAIVTIVLVEIVTIVVIFSKVVSFLLPFNLSLLMGRMTALLIAAQSVAFLAALYNKRLWE